MKAAYTDLIQRFDALPKDEQWRCLLALMERLRDKPRKSIGTFQQRSPRPSNTNAQERIKELRKEW